MRFEHVLATSQNEWAEFLGAKEECITNNAPTRKWCAPPPEFVKINIDAAFQTTTGVGGWGATVRDHSGDILLAAAGRLDHLASAFQAEAEALLKTVQLAESYGIGRALFETDCLNLQMALSSTTQDRGPLGVLFREAKYLLQLNFIEHKILFCPRECNRPAHVLAALGSSAEPGSQQVWDSDFPAIVTSAVAADMVGPE